MNPGRDAPPGDFLLIAGLEIGEVQAAQEVFDLAVGALRAL